MSKACCAWVEVTGLECCVVSLHTRTKETGEGLAGGWMSWRLSSSQHCDGTSQIVVARPCIGEYEGRGVDAEWVVVLWTNTRTHHLTQSNCERRK